jgi:RNA recognition motif-containing protein
MHERRRMASSILEIGSVHGARSEHVNECLTQLQQTKETRERVFFWIERRKMMDPSSTPSTPWAPQNKLYVAHLPFAWEEPQVRELFLPFGPIGEIILLKDKQGAKRGAGFVNFVTNESAAQAIAALDNYKVSPTSNSDLKQWHYP